MLEPKDWSYDVSGEFNSSYYSNILNYEHLQEEDYLETQTNGVNKLVPVWVFTWNKRKYVLDRDLENELPIKINDSYEVMHKKKPFYYISDFSPVKIKQEKKYQFRELVDLFMNVEHTEYIDFLLYRLISIASYLSRVNVRISSDPSFGKDSMFNAMRSLTQNVAINTAKTFAKLEYNLKNDILVLPELSNIEPKDIRTYQNFLLSVGDFTTRYEKSSLGSKKYGTQNVYDISNLSIIITFNTLKDYADTGDEDKFFDYRFSPQVRNRFLPLKLNGSIDVNQFNIHTSEVKERAVKSKDTFVNILRTLEWYKHNYITELDLLTLPNKDDYVMTGRQFRSFYAICEMIQLYSKDDEEFNMLVSRLYLTYKNYNAMLGHVDEDKQTSFGGFIK